MAKTRLLLLIFPLLATWPGISSPQDEGTDDVRGFRWGDSLKEVLSRESAKRGPNFSDVFPMYEISLVGARASLLYGFGKSEKLESINYSIDNRVMAGGEGRSILATVIDCDELLELLTTKYGRPSAASKDMVRVVPVPEDFQSWKAVEILATTLDKESLIGGLAFSWKLPRTEIALYLKSGRQIFGIGSSVSCTVQYLPSEAMRSNLDLDERRQTLDQL